MQANLGLCGQTKVCMSLAKPRDKLVSGGDVHTHMTALSIYIECLLTMISNGTLI